jgi:two-component system sensor histidine kinase RegB
LVAKDLAKSAPPDSPLAEDAHLLVSQSERCREILRQLNTRRPATDAVHERMPLQALLEEAAGPHRGLGRDIILTVEGGQPGPELQRRPEIIQGLRNLIENAVGFADSKVEIIARFTPVEIEVTVRDDGPGFSPAVLSRLGEPYVSERSAGQTGGGLGLGFFIAKTLLERSGARVEVRNRQPPNQGAVVRAVWPRGRIEIRAP